MKNIKKTAATLTLITALALTGCSSGGGKVSDETPSGSNAQSEDAKSSAEKQSEWAEENGYDEYEDEYAEDDTVPQEAKFGQTVTFPDGVSVTISEPKEYIVEDPELWEGVVTTDDFVQFDIKIVNNSGAPFDPSMSMSSVQSGNTEGEGIFDDETDGAPETMLLDGREATYTETYGVSDPSDIVLQYSTGTYEYADAIFTNTK